jgi:mono/diheme cytochrome c family protein
MDYHQIVLIHRILVSLFLLHYVVKTYLLLSGKTESLTGYTAKTRIAEMVLSVGFLGTGIYLLIAGPAASMMMWIKLAFVFASIPLAIIGFKRGKKMLAILAVILLIGAYGLAEMNKAHYAKEDKKAIDTQAEAGDPVATGKAIYTAKCVACHGANGDAGLGGAKNLKTTQMTDDQQKDIIKNGKPNTGMSAFPGLTEDQLNGLVAYIKTLKQ